MLYALFTGERGLYLRDRYGDGVSQLAFDAPVQLGENSETVRIIPLLYSHPPPLHASSICSPAEDEMLTMWWVLQSVLNGVFLPGYGASDLGVRRIVEHSEAVTRGA
jgi:hypothetical protein